MTYSVRRALTSLCAAGWDSKTAAGVLQAWAWLKSVCGWDGPVFDKRFRRGVYLEPRGTADDNPFPPPADYDGTDYDYDSYWR